MFVFLNLKEKKDNGVLKRPYKNLKRKREEILHKFKWVIQLINFDISIYMETIKSTQLCNQNWSKKIACSQILHCNDRKPCAILIRHRQEFRWIFRFVWNKATKAILLMEMNERFDNPKSVNWTWGVNWKWGVNWMWRVLSKRYIFIWFENFKIKELRWKLHPFGSLSKWHYRKITV